MKPKMVLTALIGFVLLSGVGFCAEIMIDGGFEGTTNTTSNPYWSIEAGAGQYNNTGAITGTWSFQGQPTAAGFAGRVVILSAIMNVSVNNTYNRQTNLSASVNYLVGYLNNLQVHLRIYESTEAGVLGSMLCERTVYPYGLNNITNTTFYDCVIPSGINYIRLNVSATTLGGIDSVILIDNIGLNIVYPINYNEAGGYSMRSLLRSTAGVLSYGGAYNKVTYQDTETGYSATDYNVTDGTLNISHPLKWVGFYLMDSASYLPLTFDQMRGLNYTMWIKADTHSCTHFFNPTNVSDVVYESYGFSSDKTSIPNKYWAVLALPYSIPLLTGGELNYIYVNIPQVSFYCTEPSIISHMFVVYNKTNNIYYYFNAHSCIGLSQTECQDRLADNINGSVGLTYDIYALLSQYDGGIGTIQPEGDPYAIAGMFLQPWVIIFLVMFALAGMLAQVGGMLMGGLGLAGGILLMVLMGLLPAWLGFTIIALAGVGVAMLVRSTIAGSGK